MMSILIFGLIMYIFTIFGIYTMKMLKYKEYDKNFLSIIPFIGAIVLTCIIQWLIVLLNMKIIGIIIILAIVLITIYCKNEIVFYIKNIINNKKILAGLSVIFILLSYPIMSLTQLLSFQNDNNDIAYYLSSMDWLQTHNLLDTVEYSLLYPFHSLAEFMVRETRFGTDLLGGMLCAVLNIEPHEIFSLLTIILTILVLLVGYFFTTNILNVDKKISTIIMLILGTWGGWADLIARQYVPQIFGIGCLILFIAFLIKVYEEENKKNIVLAALFLIGTLSVYAEYAVYLVAVYIAVGMVGFLIHRSSKGIKIFIPAIKVGFLSFVLNPVGMYIAAKFNFKILGQATESVGNIDPYRGNILQGTDFISKVLGFILPSHLYDNLDAKIINFYKAIIIIIVIIMAIVLIQGLIKNKDRIKYYIISISLLFGIYTLYFRFTKYAYGEYKHITSITPFMLICIGCFIYISVKKKSKIFKKAFSIIILFCVILNVANIFSIYKNDKLYFWGNELKELREAVKMLPKGEVIGVMEGTPAFIHGVTYVLRDYPITLMGAGSSYYSFLLDVPQQYSEYVIEEKNNRRADVFLSGNSEEIWANSKYEIVKYFEEIVVTPISGFHQNEIDARGNFRWTSEQESILEVSNISSEDKEIKISFYAGNGPTGNKKIKVYQSDTLIAEGETENQIITDIIEIKANSKVSIMIQSNDPLCKIDSDSRVFGFSISNFNIEEIESLEIEYGDGFYGKEFDGDGEFRWTSDNKSTIIINNTSNKKQMFAVQMLVGDGPTRKKDVEIYNKDELIAKGETGNILRTKLIQIDPGEYTDIIIYSKEPLCIIPTDPRAIGINIRSVDIIKSN